MRARKIPDFWWTLNKKELEEFNTYMAINGAWADPAIVPKNNALAKGGPEVQKQGFNLIMSTVQKIVTRLGLNPNDVSLIYAVDGKLRSDSSPIREETEYPLRDFLNGLYAIEPEGRFGYMEWKVKNEHPYTPQIPYVQGGTIVISSVTDEHSLKEGFALCMTGKPKDLIPIRKPRSICGVNDLVYVGDASVGFGRSIALSHIRKLFGKATRQYGEDFVIGWRGFFEENIGELSPQGIENWLACDYKAEKVLSFEEAHLFLDQKGELYMFRNASLREHRYHGFDKAFFAKLYVKPYES